jgi:hypothetical protein
VITTSPLAVLLATATIVMPTAAQAQAPEQLEAALHRSLAAESQLKFVVSSSSPYTSTSLQRERPVARVENTARCTSTLRMPAVTIDNRYFPAHAVTVQWARLGGIETSREAAVWSPPGTSTGSRMGLRWGRVGAAQAIGAQITALVAACRAPHSNARP